MSSKGTKKNSSKASGALAVVQPQNNQLTLSFDDQTSTYDDELQKAFDAVATLSGDVVTTIQSEVGDIEAYMDTDEFKSTMSALNAKKASGAFSVVGMVIQANEYPRYDGITKKDVRSFMVTMRITKNAISDQELARMNGRFVEDVYGDYFEIPVHCNLGRDKYAAFLAKKQLDEANEKQVDEQAAVLASAQKGDTKKRTKPSKNDGASKKQKLNDGSSKSSSDVTPSSSSSTGVPHVEEPTDDDNSMVLVSSTDLVTDPNFRNNEDRVDSSGVEIYAANEIDGQPYKGKNIIVLMKLSINKDITFSIEEKTVTSDPIPWTIIAADIKANPYITKEEKYSTTGWVLCTSVVKQKISKVDMYKYFEMMCQSTPVYTSLYQYLEESMGKPKKAFVVGEKNKSTPLENSTLCWFVVGNELTFGNPFKSEDDGYHVVYTLARTRRPDLFQKEDPATSKLTEKKMMGQIPYQFDVLQWKGKFEQTNPTITKCRVSIYVNWKHISPSTLTCEKYKAQPDNSLGINSITAWVNLMCANYPHIKMALNAKESFTANAEIKLNLDRYADAKLKGSAAYMMQPHAEARDRFMLPIFQKNLFMQRAVLLPLQTIKSCCIPVTQEYIVNVAWKDRAPPQSSPGLSDIDNTVPFRPVDLNNNVHCLSESQNTEQFFTEDLTAVNNRYNFYAMTNVCFKQKSLNFDDSLISFLRFLPKTSGEGVVWIEALRHIVCSGALKGCYKTERSPTFPDFGNASNSEKYIQYLKSFPALPETSRLFEVRLDDLQVFHPQSKLIVYFYAVSKMVDDAPGEKGRCLQDFRTPLSESILHVLTNKDDSEEENGDEEDSEEQRAIAKAAKIANGEGDGESNKDGDAGSDLPPQTDETTRPNDITEKSDEISESQDGEGEPEKKKRKQKHRAKKMKKIVSDDEE